MNIMEGAFYPSEHAYDPIPWTDKLLIQYTVTLSEQRKLYGSGRRSATGQLVAIGCYLH